MGFLTKLFGKGKRDAADEQVFYGSYDEGLNDDPVDEGLKDELFDEGLKDNDIKGTQKSKSVSGNGGKSTTVKKEQKKPTKTKQTTVSAINNKGIQKSAETKNTEPAKTASTEKNANAKSKSDAKTAAPEGKKAPAPTKDGKITAKKITASKIKAVPKIKETPSDEKAADDTAAKAPKSAVKAAARAVRSGKFDIKKSKDGRYVFNLYASNHVIIATSQTYSSSSAALTGIKSVIANAPSAPIEDQTLKKHTTLTYPKWEIYEDKGGQYRFRLCASNGSCICHSQGYTAKSNCKGGIESIIKFAKDAEIDKSYLKKE